MFIYIYIYSVSDFFHLVQHQKQKLYALSIYSVNYIGFSIASRSMISIKYIFYSLLCNKLERKYFEVIQIEPKNLAKIKAYIQKVILRKKLLK